MAIKTKTRTALDLRKEVYGYLRDGTSAIRKLQAERADIIARQKAGELGPAYDSKVLDLGIQISSMAAGAAEEASAKVDKFLAEIEESATLSPDKLTSDAKFFEMGVELTKADLAAMCKRNERNMTMMRLIRSYSEKNKVELPPEYRYDLDARQQKEEAEAVREAAALYAGRWMTGKDADQMLDRFFMIPAESKPPVEKKQWTRLTLNGSETIEHVAWQFGTTVEAIKNVNRNKDLITFPSGTTVIIPGTLKEPEYGSGCVNANSHHMEAFDA